MLTRIRMTMYDKIVTINIPEDMIALWRCNRQVLHGHSTSSDKNRDSPADVIHRFIFITGSAEVKPSVTLIRRCREGNWGGEVEVSAAVFEKCLRWLLRLMRQEEVSFRILCSNDKVGSVIGKKALESETGATITVGAVFNDFDDSCTENVESQHSQSQKAMVLVFSRFGEASHEKGTEPDVKKGTSVVAGIHILKSTLQRSQNVLLTAIKWLSGSMAAFMTNTTIEINILDRLMGSVYGENRINLARLRQVQEPHPGSREIAVVISGTPDETQAAQSLLQAFVLAGSRDPIK